MTRQVTITTPDTHCIHELSTEAATFLDVAVSHELFAEQGRLIAAAWDDPTRATIERNIAALTTLWTVLRDSVAVFVAVPDEGRS